MSIAPVRRAAHAAVGVLAWACAQPALGQAADEAAANSAAAFDEGVTEAPSEHPAPVATGGTSAAPRLDPQAARIDALEAELHELREMIADLKGSTAANIAAVRADQRANTVTIANGRPTIASGDGQFTAAFRGVFQLDAAHYDQDAPRSLATDFRRGSFGDAVENERARDLNDGANFRRARLGVEGRAFGDWEYNFLYEFGGSGVEEAGRISAAWVQYNGLGRWKIRAGAFSPPGGLEEAVSTNGSLFAERAAASELVRGIASGDGRTAAMVWANGERWTASLAWTGNLIGAQTFDEQSAFVGRLTYVPARGPDWLVHLGINSTVVVEPPASGPDVENRVATNIRLRERPELRVDGTRLVDTGNIDAEGLSTVGLEFGAQRKNLYVQAEWFGIDVQRRASALSDPNFSGWYVQTGWTITGEPRRYQTNNGTFDAPRGEKPFSWKDRSPGVWELGLRYSVLDLNHLEGAPGTIPLASTVRGGEQEIFTAGLNWYPNANVRFQAAYQYVTVDRLSPGGTAFGAAPATPPAGAQVGQDLSIWSFRTQYAF
ncbi:OprO/OprP family phosphate-selective porin [Phenylobacterium terrae]|uniref:OprO/OprP family phosphate-selective porin n=1 Tax=Phenylobacterium terrae TaxID=2665495 RepID=A0ABW4N7B7_9CAUL